MLKSEVEAEELEKQAKEDMKLKNYENSKILFEKAKEIYIQLNYNLFHNKLHDNLSFPI